MTENKRERPYPIEALELVPITTDGKFEQMWTENHSQWGSMFAKAAWLEAAKERARLEYSTDGRYKTFMVTPKNDPEQPILACCGLYERPAIFATRKTVVDKDGSTTVETRVQDVLAATVASVFSPEQYRGFGYGGWLMTQIWKYLENSPVAFSFLYSDAGSFYDRYGWKKHRSQYIEFMANEENGLWHELSTIQEPKDKCPTLEPITDDNLNEILELDASLLRDELTLQIENSPEGTTLFAVVPEPRIVGWHRSRENFFLRHLQSAERPYPSTTIDRYGVFLSAQCSPSGSSLNTLRYISWFHEFRRDQLIVMRFRHGLNKDDREAKLEALLLLQQAIEEAKRWKLKRVIIWNPHPTLCEWTGLQAQDRTSSLSYLGVCQGSDIPDQDRIPTSHVEWVMNEFYPWC
ncbi:hypothetical protein BGW42_003729 [Actinomortierella wolfii]|nr:hypothetical protein BGW42_003729 [Actinomortierella wolfii]